MAGIATFPIMAYITVFHPLFPTEGTGMGFGAVPRQQSRIPVIAH